jgi:hypothetical protein
LFIDSGQTRDADRKSDLQLKSTFHMFHNSYYSPHKYSVSTSVRLPQVHDYHAAI